MSRNQLPLHLLNVLLIESSINHFRLRNINEVRFAANDGLDTWVVSALAEWEIQDDNGCWFFDNGTTFDHDFILSKREDEDDWILHHDFL